MASTDPDAAVGLCLRCRHVHVVRSRTGGHFYRCERSATDADYPKYPRLPVRSCDGYERRGAPATDRPPRGGPDAAAGPEPALG